jgi:hypothetical protein
LPQRDPKPAIYSPKLLANLPLTAATATEEDDMAETATNPQTIVMTDPEWIALESISEETRRFIFGEAMLRLLQGRGLAEPGDELWKVTPHGQQALEARSH